MSGAAASSTGPLDGVRVVELASDHAAWAGKLLGDLGADVIVVEPPGGHPGRSYGPFVDDEPGPERSLTWWYYNTSKRGVVLDLDDPDGAARFRRLAATADIVLEGEPPGRLDAIGRVLAVGVHRQQMSKARQLGAPRAMRDCRPFAAIARQH